MNIKEIGEIRRRVRRDRSNMTSIYGCYVNENKEIISEFRQSTGMMSENEGDKYFGLLNKALSGAVGKNLIDITFKTSQVADSPEHKLLMDLRKCELQDEEVRYAFYQKVIETVSLGENYLILMGCDKYDVPFKGSDGEGSSDENGGDDSDAQLHGPCVHHESVARRNLSCIAASSTRKPECATYKDPCGQSRSRSGRPLPPG